MDTYIRAVTFASRAAGVAAAFMIGAAVLVICDIVVERFTASGTHTGGPLMGVPATGKSITVAGINIFRVNGDRIVERWGRLDEVGLLRQLGLITG